MRRSTRSKRSCPIIRYFEKQYQRDTKAVGYDRELLRIANTKGLTREQRIEKIKELDRKYNICPRP